MKKLSLLVPLVFTAPVQASEVTVGQICKAASAAMFGRDHKIMQLDKVNQVLPTYIISDRTMAPVGQ